MARIILSFLFFFFAFFSLNQNVLASNFSTDYKVTYSVSGNSRTQVNFNVTLINETAQYYASSYNIHVGFDNLENVRASDSSGPITPKVTKISKGNNIELTFNDKVTGFGNKLNFNLTFDTNEVAEIHGNVWEINIPGLSNQDDFSSFDVTVSYPSFLGKPSYIKPNVVSSSAISASSLRFSKKELGASGISIAFGDSQVYKFNLSYHLGNKNLFPVTTEIALPPSTNYQDIIINNITPAPINVKYDLDGNWLAQYKLLPSQKINVRVLGLAKVNLEGKQESLSHTDLKEYTKEKPYWQISNPRIRDLARDLKTPRNIYNYVADSLSYDFSRVTQEKPRLGAVNILNDPTSAVCLEFTDLFVTLARAAGIPAREVDGFANTENTQERPLSLVKDVLHAWPQYYDSDLDKWIMVDPTWGNTTGGVDYFNTLDLDHFAFVIKGLDSNYPIPAGGYKLSKDENSKDVDVSIGGDFAVREDFVAEVLIPKQVFPGGELKALLRVKNLGNSELKKQNAKIISRVLNSKDIVLPVGKIPPFAYADYPIKFEKTNILTNTTDQITIQLGNKSYNQSVLISPFILNEYTLGGILIVFAIVILSIIVARTGSLPFFRRKG